MKKHISAFAVVVVATFVITGCGSKGSVDTKPIETSFQSAEAATKSAADKAVAAIKSADYAGAVSELKSLASKAKLTPEQQQAIKDVMAQVEKALADVAAKAKDGAEKAAGDITKSLKK